MVCQLDGKTCVLSAFADGKRQLVLIDDNQKASFILGGKHSFNLSRSQRIFDQFAQIVIPLEDIDLFAMQLIDDDLYTGASGTDACADRINVRIVAHDSHLGALACFTGNCLDLNDALEDFGNFLFEQTLDQHRIRSGNKHL